MLCNRIYITITTLLVLTLQLTDGYAQQSPKADATKAKKSLREGNQLYRNNKMAEADSAYRQSSTADPQYYKAYYNRGNALYRLKKHEEARKSYEQTLKHKSLTKEQQSMVHHNVGNTYLSENKYDEAIAAYKKSLRLNPYNYDTKYNLAYAQQKKNNGGGGGKNDQQQNKEEQKQNESQKPREAMTKEEAEAILNAMRQDEQNLQEKNNKEPGVPMRNVKDW